jgi:hypothetical protein
VKTGCRLRRAAGEARVTCPKVVRSVDLMLDQLPVEQDPAWKIIGLGNTGISDLGTQHDEHLTEEYSKEINRRSAFRHRWLHAGASLGVGCIRAHVVARPAVHQRIAVVGAVQPAAGIPQKDTQPARTRSGRKPNPLAAWPRGEIQGRASCSHPPFHEVVWSR